jgi:hypothetical protein
MQNRTQQRTVHLGMPVVADKAQLAKLVHEMTDARAGSADHLSRRFLTAFGLIGWRVSERMCKQVSVSLPYRGDSHDDRHDDYT